jgi:hypothetical protein
VGWLQTDSSPPGAARHPSLEILRTPGTSGVAPATGYLDWFCLPTPTRFDILYRNYPGQGDGSVTVGVIQLHTYL